MTNKFTPMLGEHTLYIFTPTVHHPFDASANGVCLQLDETTYLIFEDPLDGYRSACGKIITYAGTAESLGLGYPELIRAPVLVRQPTREDFEGIELLDRRNGKTILLLGTDNLSDYYPCFFCEWSPGNIWQDPGLSEF
jgi:hypothetical protein